MELWSDFLLVDLQLKRWLPWGSRFAWWHSGQSWWCSEGRRIGRRSLRWSRGMKVSLGSLLCVCCV
jgi:hypothetical protein